MPDIANVGDAQPHGSARGHVSGNAQYIDDLPEFPGLLHIAIGRSSIARGTVTSMDLTDVRNAPGVVDVITSADIREIH